MRSSGFLFSLQVRLLIKHTHTRYTKAEAFDDSKSYQRRDQLSSSLRLHDNACFCTFCTFNDYRIYISILMAHAGLSKTVSMLIVGLSVSFLMFLLCLVIMRWIQEIVSSLPWVLVLLNFPPTICISKHIWTDFCNIVYSSCNFFNILRGKKKVNTSKVPDNIWWTLDVPTVTT